VLFANSPKGLQEILGTFEQYCNRWKLTVNVSKTKILVFGTRKYNGNTNFQFGGETIDIVNEFKYLGITFTYNGKFKNCANCIVSQAQRAMYGLLSKCKKFDLRLESKFELFDKTIVPILTYGCEIWGFEKHNAIEKVHLRFLKYVLGLKKSTPNVMVYGETGRVPICITTKIRCVNYWLKVVSSKHNSLRAKMYSCLLELYRNDTFNSPWLLHVRDILNECGLSYVWLLQGEEINDVWLKKCLQRILFDQFVTTWRSDMDNSSKCDHYRNFKAELVIEPYLSLVPRNVYKVILKLRTSNHHLPIETGRYSNIDRRLRICQICTDRKVGDEYHYLFECSNPVIVAARNEYLPIYYHENPSTVKFYSLFKDLDSESLLKDLCKFVKIIFRTV
jgi:hypothetical protein